MASSSWLFLLAALLPAYQLSRATQVYCYHDSQAYWRKGSAQFRIRELEEGVEHCDTLVYGHAAVDPASFQVKPLDAYLDTDEGRQQYRHVTNLKRPFPNLKVLLSVGGSHDTEQRGKYLTLLESAENRTAFVNSARAIARRYNFDGIELAWQFPEMPPPRHVSVIGRLWESVQEAFVGRKKAELRKVKLQRDGFTALVNDLKAALQVDDMVLTAVAYPLVNATAYFDIPEVVQHVDAVVLRAFDYNTPDKNRSAASLSAPLDTTGDSAIPMSATATVKLWLDSGAPAGKLILGIPTFGRTWTVRNHSAGSRSTTIAADGPGVAGPLTKTRGLLAYPEICNNFTSSSSDHTCTKTTVVEGQGSASSQVGLHAYCHGSLTWVSFDDPEMAGRKASYARKMRLGGVEMFDMSLDDFVGVCGHETYPILHEVRCSLQGDGC